MQLTYLNKSDLYTFLQTFGPVQKIGAAMFSNIFILDTYLNKIVNRLYTLEVGEDKFLVVKRVFRKEYRFLFKEPPPLVLKSFIETFDPAYISVHFLQYTEIDEHITLLEKEIICSTSLKDLNPEIQRKYKQSLQRNKGLCVENFEYKQHIADLIIFLESWRCGRSQEKDIWVRIENDLNLMASYGSANLLQGLVVRDFTKENKIVGYNIFVSSSQEGVSLSICSKVLRGYVQLGVFLKVESFKKMRESGFQRVNLGQINNDFKKAFDSDFSIHMYHKELYISSEFSKTVVDRQKFLMMYF